MSESEDDFLLFLRFLTLGPGRTLDAATPEDGDKKAIQRLAAQHDWFSRVDAWDRSLDLSEATKERVRRNELLEQMWLDGLKLRKQAFVVLAQLAQEKVSSLKNVRRVDSKNTLTTEMSVKDAMSMMKEGHNLQAQACGLGDEQDREKPPPTQINFVLQDSAKSRMKHVEVVQPNHEAESALPDLVSLPETPEEGD